MLRKTASFFLSICALGLAACDGAPLDPGPDGGATGGGAPDGGGAGGADPGPPASPKALVKFKAGKRLAAELTRVLGLDPSGLCAELDAYDCFVIHKVVLGDPDAFGIGLYEPLSETASTAPIAVDRVVLSACRNRVDQDLAAPNKAVLYGDLPISNGALTDPSADAVKAVVERLYERALGRKATDGEIASHLALYADIQASGKSDAPARDWALLSCFSTLTTLEFLFY